MQSTLVDPTLPGQSEQPPPSLADRTLSRWPVLETWLAAGRRFVDSRWFPPALLGFLFVVSTLERLHGLHYHYWIDEAISVSIASHPLSQLHHLLKQDGSPPLYYLMLHVWIGWFGKGPTATHILSFIPAQLSIFATWWAARPQGKAIAVYAVIISALLSYTSSYAEETRMYAWMILWGTLITGSLLRVFIHRQRRYLPVFAVSLAAALYTHNWGLFLAVSCFVAIAITIWIALPGERRALIIDGIIGLGVAAILYLPWLPTLLFQTAHTGAPWAERTTLWSWTQGTYYLSGGRAQSAVLLLGFAGGLYTTYRYAEKRGLYQREVWILSIMAILTFAMAWVVGKGTPSFTFRYEAAIVAPLLLLISAGLARGRWLAVVAVLLCCAWWITDQKTQTISAKSNVGTLAGYAHPHMGTDPLVISTQPEQISTLAYYMPWVYDFRTVFNRPPDPTVVNWVNMLSNVEHATIAKDLQPYVRALKPGQTVSLVIPYALQPTTKYLKLIDKDSVAWRTWLYGDTQLKFVGQYSEGLLKSSGPVRDYVFRKK